MNYRQTLRSPRWRRLKWRRLMVAGFKCERCGLRYIGRSPRRAIRYFDLHHVTYERVGQEGLGDVRVLCRTCHALVHDKLETAA